jgi:hypothetical protein
MRAGECEVGEARVVEARDLPAIGRVTRFAGGWKSRGAMIQDAVLLKIPRVATNALRAEPDVSSHRCPRVTGIAGKPSVRTNQWEAIPVVLNCACVHAPPLHRVAVLTLRAELPLVEIRVAICAPGSGLGKNFRYVARITRYILVHPTKLKVGFGIVIELKLRPKGGPTRSGVTVLTRERELPMRIFNIDLR